MRSSEYAELKAFVAIVEHGSFRRAAAHLGVSPSALSQTFKVLEERLGSRLLNRTTRSIALTDTGARLLGKVAPAFATLEEAVVQASATPGTVAGRLRLNVTRDAAIHHLAPRIAPFLQGHPGIELDVVVEDRLVDIVGQGFDAGIRLGERLEQDMVAVRVSGPLSMVVVAAPRYLERHGTPQSPHDLHAHQCLAYRRPTDGSVYRWEFENEGSTLEVAVNGPLLVSDPELLTRVAVDGLGIAYVFAHQVQRQIAEGTLVQLLSDWTPPFPGFYLYYPSRRLMTAPLQALVRSLADAKPLAPDVK
ncbi:LysR family transcriptional regulator [Pseudomonas putida]